MGPDIPRPPGALDPSLDRLRRDPEFDALYQVTGILGRGGMASVMRGVHRATGREVAIKVLDGAGVPAAATRIVREGQVLSRIRHPGIVKMYDAGLVGDCPYLVLELAPGGSLRERLDANGAQSLETAVETMVPCLKALAALHAEGVLHRDFKPDNILYGADGLPRLADFGLALERNSERLTDPSMFIGTLRYSAPEVIRGDPYTPPADVYSAGATLYEMLGGRPPFDGATFNEVYALIAHHPPAPLLTLRPELPRSLCALVEACLAKDPQDRPQSAGHVADELLRTSAPRLSSVMSSASQRAMRVMGGQQGLRAAVGASLACLLVSVGLLGRYLTGGAAPAPRSAGAAAVEALPEAVLARAEEAVRRSRQAVEEGDDVWTGVAATSLPLGADMEERAGAIVRPQVALRAELALSLAPLSAAGEHGRLDDRAEALLAVGACAQFGQWYLIESCRIATGPPDIDLPAGGAESVARARAQREASAMLAALQRRATVVLSRAAAAPELDGERLAALLDGLRYAAHAVVFMDWQSEFADRIRRSTELWMQDLEVIGDERRPLGRAAHGCWVWGGRRYSRASDNRVVGQARVDLLTLAERARQGGQKLRELAARLQRDLGHRL